MKYLTMLSLTIFLLGCSKRTTPIHEDIENIVNVVASEKSLIYETTSPLDPKLFKKQANNEMLSSNIRIPFLMSLKYKNKKVFNSKDSVYFFQQNKTLVNFKLGKKRYGNLFVDSKANPFIYKFSIPLFSKNHGYAFIHADHVIPRHSGSGSIFLLKKVNDKWKIIYKTSWWES